ncbi:DUF3105 domain-containing protein [Streptomyces nodosus]|uniref:DUF3105 domain-containing protein n=1 Tax=Streptomyces nodosus TaxID=40318 RepID=A0A0B5DIY1_9ACTN|nr:DUF3105 domain-containing protein [Streptomyces nodosus]AJE40411.1 membrane protein [Streptomyces nodosus]MBB4791441.1 hypothetical protein [Streptomyces nodosus]QEV38976.1 DUF3105 domain-containing protein [Streptomyces nodosus]
MGSAEKSPATERSARSEELRRAERVRERRGRILAIGAAVVVVAGLVVGGVVLIDAQSNGGAAAASDPKDSKDSKDPEDSKGGDAKDRGPKGPGHFVTGADGVRTWTGTLTRNHTTETVKYPMEPPVGGDHHPAWQNCDGEVYAQPIDSMNAVHALEHGAVWVTYNGQASKADVDALGAKVRRTPYTLMSPVGDQKDPVMLTAWGHQRTVRGASDPAVDAFLAKFVQGSQTPEPGAPCTGGLGQ